MSDEEVEYVSDDEDYAPRPKEKNILPGWVLHKIENQYSFYRFDGKQLLGPGKFILQDFLNKQSVYEFSVNDPTDNAVSNKNSFSLTGASLVGKEQIFQSEAFKQYNLNSDVIIWTTPEKLFFISPEITYDFIDKTTKTFNFFIDQIDYRFQGSGNEGGAISNAIVKLSFEDKKTRDEKGSLKFYYTFMDYNSLKIYNFERNGNNQFQLIISNNESSIRFFDIYGDTSVCYVTLPNGKQDVGCLDDISETLDEEEESDDNNACISCGEYYHIGDDDESAEYKGLCAPCIISLKITDSDGIVYKPIKQLSFFTFDKLSKKKNGLNSRPNIAGPKLIITMFSFLSGHGMVVNKDFRGKINTIRAQGSALYGTPGWTATELVEASTFRPGTQCQGNYTCKTHIICIGNPLLPTITTISNNGTLINDMFDNLAFKNVTVDESVKNLIKFQNLTHKMSLSDIKQLVTDKRNDSKTNDRIVANYYRAQQSGELWGICSNIGKEEIKTAEKYISGYNDEREMASRIRNNTDLDEAVTVQNPIVRAKFCNIYYENAAGGVEANSNIIINNLFKLPNGIRLSEVNRNCEKYLCETVYSYLTQTDINVKAAITQNPHIELVSIILDNTCNYTGSGIVLSHSGQVPYGFKQTETSYMTIKPQQASASASSFGQPQQQQQASQFGLFGQRQQQPSPFGQQPFSLFGRRGGVKKTKGKVYKNTRNHRKASKKRRKIRTRKHKRKSRK